jgi:hypothetical protein
MRRASLGAICSTERVLWVLERRRCLVFVAHRLTRRLADVLM